MTTKKLRLLTLFTAVVLASIAVMQAYWLYSFYKEERERFTSETSSALLSTITTIQLQKILSKASPGLKQVLAESASVGVTERKKGLTEHSQGVITINLEDSNAISQTNKVAELTESIQKLEGDSILYNIVSLQDLASYKALFAKQLDARGISISFDLAMVHPSGNILLATCDTGRFKNATMRTPVIKAYAVNMQNHILSAAFHDAPVYIFKQIAWLFVITVFLVLIGTASLTYLLILFFRQKAMSEIRDDFMNNMTHELKTPVSSIGVALEMVLDESRVTSEEKKKGFLTVAQMELHRLNAIIDNVLRIASLERSEIHIIKSSIEVKPWLEGVLQSFLPVLEKQGITLNLRVDPVDLVIQADKTHFTNLIQNLIENAIKYSKKESPSIFLNVVNERDTVVLEIADNGIGIPHQYIDKIFDKFFRVPSGDRHDIKGYGLGLSYVKAIIDLHEGSIRVESNPGEGSRFVIVLPSDNAAV